MTLPASSLISILLLVFAALSWACWPLFQKRVSAMDRRWGFEFFFGDFAIGAALMALILAFTAGNLGFDGLRFMDILAIGAKRKMFFSILTGAAAGAGLMCLLAASVVSGLGFAFAAWGGFALAAYSVTSILMGGSLDGTSALLAAAAGLAAAFVATIPWRNAFANRRTKLPPAEEASDQSAAATAAKRKKRRRKAAGATKATLLASGGGIAYGILLPVLEWASLSEDGLGPYGAGFFSAAGVFAGALVSNLFFLNLPMIGKPVEVLDFVRLPVYLHLFGLAAGAIWVAGAVAHWVAVYPGPGPAIDPSMAAAIVFSSAVAGALWGILKRGDYSDQPASVRSTAVLSLAVLAGGLVLLAI